MTLKWKNKHEDKRKRKAFRNAEIIFECCSLLIQSHFSNRLKYFLFKRRHKFFFVGKFKNTCLISGYSKSVFSRFKTSRHALLKKTLNGSVTGFYWSVW